MPSSPELLFSEIMGVVKGSSVTARTLTSLSRDEYVTKSGKLSPAFTTEVERERVFSAFERYEKLKKQRDEVDELDRVIELLKALKDNPTLAQNIRQCFEEAYVDGIDPSKIMYDFQVSDHFEQRFRIYDVLILFCF